MTITFPRPILLESGCRSSDWRAAAIEFAGQHGGLRPRILTRASWILLFPSAVIILTTLSISIIGDWLRDRSIRRCDDARGDF